MRLKFYSSLLSLYILIDIYYSMSKLYLKHLLFWKDIKINLCVLYYATERKSVLFLRPVFKKYIINEIYKGKLRFLCTPSYTVKYIFMLANVFL